MRMKKLICLLLAAVLLLGLLPAAALATSGGSGHIQDIKWNRGKKADYQVYMKSETFPYIKPFQFDPATTEYDLVFPYMMGPKVDYAYGYVTFTDAAKDNDKVYGRVSVVYDIDPDTSAEKVAYRFGYQAGQFPAEIGITDNNTGLGWTNTVIAKNGGMNAKNPPKVVIEAGVLNSGDINTAALDDATTYVFNYYRCAGFTTIKATYEDNSTALNLNYYSKGYHIVEDATNVTIDNVKKGTVKLNLSLTTNSGSVLKVDNGEGTYTAGPTATTFALDLTKYGDTYQNDGSLVIPFMLDYDQESTGSCALDGYYTLTVNFEKDSAISPTTETFDLNQNGTNNKDIAVTLDLKGNTLSGIKNGTTALAKDTDYTVSDTTVTLKKAYLDTLAEGTASLTFEFSAGETQTLSVTVTDTTTSLPTQGYVKDLKIFQSGYNEDIVTLLDSFTPEQHEYKIAPRPAIENCGAFNFYLADDTDWEQMRVTATIKASDGTTVAQSDVHKVTKNRLVMVQTFQNILFPGQREKIPAGFFCDLAPDDYVLTVKVYEEGKEDTADVYTVNFSRYPILGTLTIHADGKQLVTDPDAYMARSSMEQSKVMYKTREFTVNTQGSEVLDLRFSAWDWRDLTQGKDVEALTLVCNGVSYPIENATKQDGLQLFIYATVDLKDCQGTGGVYEIPFHFVYGSGESQKTGPDYVLRATVGTDSGWTISNSAGTGTHDKGAEATLSVTVTGDRADKVSYKWEWATEASARDENFGHGNGLIEGETGASLLVPTRHAGRRVYRCTVTDKETGAFEYKDFTVDVNLGKVNAPVIVTQPGKNEAAKTAYFVGETMEPIQVCIGTDDEIPGYFRDHYAELSVQWFYNEEPTTEGATLLDKANYKVTKDPNGHAVPDSETAPFFNTNIVKGNFYYYEFPEALPVGEHYFFCVATATVTDDPTNTATITSDILKITVSERKALEGFEGKGTEEDPYLIETVAQLKKIDEYVMAGNSFNAAVFRMENDLTVPADWEPIGAIKGTIFFSGIIDGNGKTLTYEKGARPLLELTRDAVVKNLKIYGEEINGAGLLETATIDYGDDGVYQVTDPNIITVENVTLLSGSKTKGSGLVNGGYTSGINNIFIRNCTVEEGVVIGYTKDQSGIGSFVGTLNGSIENSISYADVYGVRAVGGLAGGKGQSMGLCEVINSAFLGTVTATGGKVGGIIGSGYITDTAPNTPAVTVRNCFVVADITGNSTESREYLSDYDRGSGIGGIIGSDIGMRGLRDEAFVSDNYFLGTITDTNPDAATAYDRVGGIIGELGAYSSAKQHYGNNYYLASEKYDGIGYLLTENAAWKPETESFIPTAAAAFADGTVTAALNQGAYKNWLQSEFGYPVHSSAPVAMKLTVSGSYKTSYLIGDKFSTDGMVFTVTYSDGSKVTVPASEITFSGFDSSKQAYCTVKAELKSISAQFQVVVLLPDTGTDSDKITVTFKIMGDKHHNSDEDGQVHTLSGGGLETWLPEKSYTLDHNATVLDLVEYATAGTGITFTNPSGQYINSVTYNGVTLGEFSNGNMCGWMYTLNGAWPLLSVAEQFLSDGDKVILHFTDDFMQEDGSEMWNTSGGGASGGSTKKDEKKAEGDGMALKPEELKASADAGKGVDVVTENGTVKLSAETVKELAKDGTEVAVEVKANEDGTTTVNVTAGDKAVAANVKVELPAKEGQMLVVVGADGKETPVILSASEGGKVYAVIPAGATVKAVDAKGLSFGDVKASDWFAGAVEFVTSHGIFQGTDQGFEPTQPMNRAMLAMVLFRISGEAAPSGGAEFGDVKPEDWFADAVAWASGAGIVNGRGEGFAPDAPVTREEIATMLYRFVQYLGVSVSGSADLSKFPDGGDTSSWAGDAMAWAVSVGLFQGDQNGALNPGGEATRAEVATLVERLVTLLVK